VPSPINRPLPAFATAVAITAAAETVVVTSPLVIVDTPQNVVVLHGLVDITVDATGSAVTLFVRRGATVGGTLITSGNTWGPFTVTATDEYQFVVMGFDDPPIVFGETYVLTAQVTAGAAGSTVNSAYLEAIVTART
jgi:hypothetical protein